MKHWKLLKQFLWQWRGVLIATPSVAAIVVLIRLTGLLQTAEWALLDHYFRSRPAESKDDRIVIIGVHESDVTKYNFPLSDRDLATLLTKIKQQEPSAIGLDLYRNLPVGSGYAKLKQIFESTPNLVGVQKVVQNGNLETVGPPPVLKELGQVTANDIVIDGDGKLRRGLLSVTARDQTEYLGFAFALSLLHLQLQGIEPQNTPAGLIKLGKTEFVPFQGNDGSYVRADDAGYQVLINYRGSQTSFDILSVDQVLQGKLKPDQLRGKIVMIGSVAQSLNDVFETPYNLPGTQIRRSTPGVEIHAQITSQILSSVLEQRPSIRTLSETAELLWITSWTLLGALLIWLQRAVGSENSKIHAIKIFCSFLLVGGGLLTLTFLAFLQSWWLPVMPAMLGLSGSAIAITAYLAQSATELRKTLGRYLTDEVVSRLLETPEGLTLIGETRKVTILMTDIRGFTSISEKLSPQQVVALLNVYLKAMTKVIKEYGGTINDITGDGIVIFFGAPIQHSDDSHRAVACAIAMQLAMESVNQQAQDLNFPKLEIGIGINTGEVVVGNIGSEELAKYTAIGSHVNLASRIESFTVGGQILISPSTYAEVQSVVRVEGQTQASMKGVNHPVTLYEVTGIGKPYQVFLPSQQDTFVELQVAITVEFELLEGKHLSGKVAIGKLTKLSNLQGAVIQASALPAPLSNLKLRLLEQDCSDIYAKVTSQAMEDGTSFCIRFTDLPTDAAAVLQNLSRKQF
jgi:adenylate cyclase